MKELETSHFNLEDALAAERVENKRAQRKLELYEAQTLGQLDVRRHFTQSLDVLTRQRDRDTPGHRDDSPYANQD
jgi:hypothetical protein